jgi:hypothetical protein
MEQMRTKILYLSLFILCCLPVNIHAQSKIKLTSSFMGKMYSTNSKFICFYPINYSIYNYDFYLFNTDNNEITYHYGFKSNEIKIDSIIAVTFVNDNIEFITKSKQDSIYMINRLVYDISSDKMIKLDTIEFYPFQSLSLNVRSHILSIIKDNVLKIYNLSNNLSYKSYDLSGMPNIIAHCLNKNSTKLYFGNGDSIFIYDLQKNKLLCSFEYFILKNTSFQVSPLEKYLCMYNRDRSVNILKLPTGEYISGFSTDNNTYLFSSIYFTANDKEIIAYTDGYLFQINVENIYERTQISDDYLNGSSFVLFTKDSSENILGINNSSNNIYIWDIERKQKKILTTLLPSSFELPYKSNLFIYSSYFNNEYSIITYEPETDELKQKIKLLHNSPYMQILPQLNQYVYLENRRNLVFVDLDNNKEIERIQFDTVLRNFKINKNKDFVVFSDNSYNSYAKIYSLKNKQTIYDSIPNPYYLSIGGRFVVSNSYKISNQILNFYKYENTSITLKKSLKFPISSYSIIWAFNTNDSYIIISDPVNGSNQLFNTNSFLLIKKLNSIPKKCSIKFFDKKHIIVFNFSTDTLFQIINVDADSVIHTELGCFGVIHSITFTNNHKYLYIENNVKGVMIIKNDFFNYLSVEDINQKTFQEISLVPNPATDYIEIIASSLAPWERARVRVYNLLGNVVVDTPPGPLLIEGEKIRLDVSGLAAGVYFVRVGGKMYKFVKM